MPVIPILEPDDESTTEDTDWQERPTGAGPGAGDGSERPGEAA